jgi:CBS domain-containing protein
MKLADLERRFAADNVSGYPVVDGSTLRGVVSALDIIRQVCQERAEAELTTAFYEDETGMEFESLSSDWVSAQVGKRVDHERVSDVMSSNVISVSPETSLHDVAALMNEKKIHRVLVVKDQCLVGLISSLDIVRACGDDLVDISFTPPKILDF